MKLSVIIPCYNAEKWISDCLHSAINQTYKDKEIILVDNESTDSTMSIVRDIQSNHPEVQVYTAANIYPNCWDEARFLGFEKATGDYLVTLCSDDVIEPQYLKNISNYFENNPEALAVQSFIQGINNGARMFMPYQGFVYNSLEEYKKLSVKSCVNTSPSVVFSRTLYDSGKLITYPEKYSGAADYDLYCRLADEGILIHCIPVPIGYKYRWHQEQATWEMFGTDYDKKIQSYWRDKWSIVA